MTLLVVKKKGDHNCKTKKDYLITTKPFKKGEVIAKIDASKTCEKAWSSLQIGKDKHIDVGDTLLYMNHSCNPSTIIDTENLQLIANKDLSKGDIISFFYPSTEWEMSQPFECWCGSENCLKKIDGAKNLNVKDLRTKYHFAKHILELSGLE